MDNFLDPPFLIAVFLLLVCCFAVSWLSSRLQNHWFKAKYLELEYDLTALAERFSRDQKVRAGVKAQSGKRLDDKILEEIDLVKGSQPVDRLSEWKKKFGGVG